MKFTKNLMEVLKNFSTINANMQFYEGSQQKTVALDKTILAVADVDVEFPMDFGIMDLTQFLNVLSLFDDPDVEIDPVYVTIKQGKQVVKYRCCNFAALNMLTVPKSKDYSVLPSVDVTVTLQKEILEKVLSAAKLLRSEYIKIEGDGDKIRIGTINLEDSDSSSAQFELGDTDKVFKLIIKEDNIKVIKSSYDIELSKARLTRFISTDQNLFYVIPCEKSSTFEG